MSNVKPSELRPFPHQVRKILAEAINDHDVRYRILDANHIMLFDGSGPGGPTIKVSRSRRPEDSVKFLTDWLGENIESWTAPPAPKPAPPAPELRPSPASAMAVHSSGTRGSEIKDTHIPEPPVEAPEDGWRLHVSDTTGLSYGFETDGEIYRCTKCDYLQDGSRGLHLHAAKHTDPEAAASNARKAAAVRAANRAKLAAAATLLADHFGVGSSALTEELEQLRKDNDRLSAELATANARLAKLREALS